MSREITHRYDHETERMVQLVSPSRLREILDADGDTHDRPAYFRTNDEWKVEGYEEEGREMDGQTSRITVDEENNAEEWWTAAQTPEAIEAAPAAIRPILTGEAEEVIVSAVEERQILTWAATLPGWADGPEYARYPLLANPVE